MAVPRPPAFLLLDPPAVHQLAPRTVDLPNSRGNAADVTTGQTLTSLLSIQFLTASVVERLVGGAQNDQSDRAP